MKLIEAIKEFLKDDDYRVTQGTHGTKSEGDEQSCPHCDSAVTLDNKGKIAGHVSPEPSHPGKGLCHGTGKDPHRGS